MVTLNEAKIILKSIGMPKTQQSDICGYTFLSMAGLVPTDIWTAAGNNWIRIHDIIRLKDIVKYDYSLKMVCSTKEKNNFIIKYEI